MTTFEDRFLAVMAEFLHTFNRAAEKGVVEFVLDTPPCPASRPRVTRWGVYYGKRYQEFLDSALDQALGWRGMKAEGPIMVFIENVSARPKTSKRGYPVGDVDNYAKGPLDALTKSEKFWEDDDQVVCLTTAKRFASPGEEPHVKLYWYEI